MFIIYTYILLPKKNMFDNIQNISTIYIVYNSKQFIFIVTSYI